MLLILSVSMLTIAPFALTAGLSNDPAVRVQLIAFALVFSVLGGFEVWLLVTAARRMGRVGAWHTDSWWATTDTTEQSATLACGRSSARRQRRR
jgi:Na+/melibiose symporter-like transporter